MNYSISMDTKVFEEGVSKYKLKSELLKMCDSSYIGENEENFLIKDEKGNYVSMFEIAWNKAKNKSTIEIIEDILNDFYNSDREYYIDAKIKILKVSNKIVVSTGYIIID